MGGHGAKTGKEKPECVRSTESAEEEEESRKVSLSRLIISKRFTASTDVLEINFVAPQSNSVSCSLLNITLALSALGGGGRAGQFWPLGCRINSTLTFVIFFRL